MAPKRKSDAIELPEDISATVPALSTEGTVLQPSLKKARVANTPAAPQPSSSKDKSQSWKDIELDGEGEVRGSIYTTCHPHLNPILISRAVYLFSTTKYFFF